AWSFAPAITQAGGQGEDAVAAWLVTAQINRRALLALMDGLHAHPVPEPHGSYDSLVAYDRHRLLKEQLLTATVAVGVDMTLAVGALEGIEQGNKAAEQTPVEEDLPPWHEPALRLERALLRGDAGRVAEQLPAFVELFQHEPLLFRPLEDGGHPRQVLQATLAQAILRALLASLPRLGLLCQTYELLVKARSMEQTGPEDMAAG